LFLHPGRVSEIETSSNGLASQAVSFMKAPRLPELYSRTAGRSYAWYLRFIQ